MGLDMYMSKKTYVKQWSHNKPEDQFDVDVKKGGEPFTPIKKERISEVVEEVGYWRKFNALHNWFVNECGDGEDNCQEIYIGEKLPELLETLHKVKEVYDSNPPDKEEQLDDIFPTSSGFFFGGTEYDEYYIEQVNETINLLTELLKEDENGDYYYQASW
jgi:hypothetical protein